MNEIEPVKFEQARTSAENFYKEIVEVYCPYFKEKIAFNAKGFRHLKFKSDRQARSKKDQYYRLKLLHLAPLILNTTRTLQGLWQTRRFEMLKINSRWEHIMRDVTFYEFIAVLKNIRAKVIVKEIHGGERYFWSIFPYWGIDKARGGRILYSGSPEHD